MRTHLKHIVHKDHIEHSYREFVHSFIVKRDLCIHFFALKIRKFGIKITYVSYLLIFVC